MNAAQAAHGGAAAGWPPVLVLLALALCGYAGAALRARRARRGWSGWRTASFAAGVVLLAAAALSAPAVSHDPRGHMLQHLVVGMYAPLALVMAAPVTLALRTMPVTLRRPVARLLRSRPLHVLSHPVTALLLDIGGLSLVHLTPLYAATQTRPALHALVHLHYFAAGSLFAWAIAGPDPAPRRPGMGTRLAVLFLAIAAHSLLAKLLYAYPDLWPPGVESTAALPEAAILMYYGGDLAELLLLAALFAGWYRRRSRSAAVGGPGRPLPSGRG